MLKTRIILLVASAAVVFLIFLLPKVVVDNEKSSNVENKSSDTHFEGSNELLSKIASFRAQIEKEKDPEKSAIFADSLVRLYAEALKFDSAAVFSEKRASFFDSSSLWLEAAGLYIKAQQFTTEDGEKSRQMGKNAIRIYEQILSTEPNNLDARSNLIVTQLNLNEGPPMALIQQLQSLIKEHPDHVPTLMNLGMMSIRSSQLDRASERFSRVLEIEPENSEATFYLGYTLVNLGDTLRGKELLEKVKHMDSDPLIRISTDSYLRNLK